MQIHYGPRGLHAELSSGLDRLVAERRRIRWNRRAARSRAR
jgi:hypothetical protein